MWLVAEEDLRFLAVNEAAVRRYGYARDEFLALRVGDIRMAESADAFRSAMQRMLASGDAHRELVRHRCKDGTLLDVEISSSPVAFLGTRARLVGARDVTRLLALEAEREDLIAQERRSRASAERAARHFQVLFEAAPGK